MVWMSQVPKLIAGLYQNAQKNKLLNALNSAPIKVARKTIKCAALPDTAVFQLCF